MYGRSAIVEKAIGSSLDAKVLLYVPEPELRQQLESFNRADSSGNGVDELRYLFLASQVELLDAAEAIDKAEYSTQSENVSIGVVKADGQKCDRCWNYSTHVGEFADDPTICERCNSALAGKF